MQLIAVLVLAVRVTINQAPAEIVVDTGKRTPISPYIYGINYPDSRIADWLKEWDSYRGMFTLAREGGNRFTAYNWETNASNAGNDYHFENDDYLAPTDEPGWTVKTFLQHVQPTGAAALLTVPTLGYVSADKDTKRDGGMDVNHSKDWIHTRFYPSIARKPGRHFEYPPDLTDNVVFQDEFVHWVEQIASKKSPVWFSLDNEPDFWHNTHLRIQPVAPTYAQIIKNNIDYAWAIKNVAPHTLVFGPVNYGWYGMRTFQGATDAHGRIFVGTYLDAMREAEQQAHKRLLDVYDFHWYPEAKGGGARIIYGQAADKPETVDARIQAPRSLWDPTYIEDSWITNSLGNKPIRLLPYMQETIDKHYPKTKLAITEYEFGARNSISGALAQADALGVFGRFGLFAACHWGVNNREHAAMAAFESFTNFDRNGSKFGDEELGVSGESPAMNSVYAALDSKNPKRMTLVIINKTHASQPMHVMFRLFRPKSARGFVVTDGVYDQPAAASVQAEPDGLRCESPALSISTIEIMRA